MLFGNDRQVEDIKALYEDMRRYVGAQTEYMKIEVVEKVSRLLSMVVVGLIGIILTLVMLMYLSLSGIWFLATKVGGMGVSFAIVGGIYLVLIVVLIVMRKRWIVRPTMNFLANLLLSDDDEADENSPS